MQGEKIIEMSSRNKHLRHEKPVGDEIIFVFDLDYCLFQSKEMYDSENEIICETFLKLTNQTDKEFWHRSLQNSGNLYRKAFYYILGVHPKDYVERMYDIPEYQKYLKPSPKLKNLLESVKIRKFCFTNGSKMRAEILLRHLELFDIFDAVVCIDSLDVEFICKPEEGAFRFLENFLNIKNPSKVYFFDDSLSNVNAAIQMGWNGIHVTLECEEHVKELLANLNVTI